MDYKVGDMVRIVDSYHEEHNGLVRRVEGIRGNLVFLDTPSGKRWLYDDLVEPADGPPITESIHF